MDAPPGQARNLALGPGGYWVAGRGEAVSYPADGNDLCYAIEDGSFWFRHRNDVVVAAVRRHPPQGPVFDVGGGNGFVAAGLERAGFPAVVVEPGPAGAANARRRGLGRVVCSTLEGAGFEPGAVDAVGLFDVIEHVEDDRAFLRSVRPLVRPGGRVYLTVPAFGWLWSREDQAAGHFRRYTGRSLAGVLRASGFEVEYLTYFFWFLPAPVFLLRAVPSWVGWRGKPTVRSARREHAVGGGVGGVGRVVGAALAGEVARVASGGTVPFGGSCLAVARRPG